MTTAFLRLTARRLLLGAAVSIVPVASLGGVLAVRADTSTTTPAATIALKVPTVSISGQPILSVTVGSQTVAAGVPATTTGGTLVISVSNGILTAVSQAAGCSGGTPGPGGVSVVVQPSESATLSASFTPSGSTLPSAATGPVPVTKSGTVAVALC